MMTDTTGLELDIIAWSLYCFAMDIGEKRLLLIGDYSREVDFHNGISSKLSSLDALTRSMYSSVEILTTRSWRNSLDVLLRLRHMLVNTDDVFCCLSLNGARYLLPLVVSLGSRLKKRVFYFQPGIGTLLLESPSRDPIRVVRLLGDPRSWTPSGRMLARVYRKLDGYIVETKSLGEAASTIYGLKRVSVFPNFRDWTPRLPLTHGGGPIKLVYFARVTPSKGLGMLLEAMADINAKAPGAFNLEVWGLIEDREWFSKLSWPSNCRYLGVSDGNDKQSLLHRYDWLVLPTCSWEGVPGTIVESRFAGLPVLCSSFPSAADLVTDDQDGYVYPFGDKEGLVHGLERVLLAKDRLSDFQFAAMARSSDFTIQKAYASLLSIVSQ